MTSRALGSRGGPLSEPGGSNGGRLGLWEGRCLGVDVTAVTISHCGVNSRTLENPKFHLNSANLAWEACHCI